VKKKPRLEWKRWGGGVTPRLLAKEKDAQACDYLSKKGASGVQYGGEGVLPEQGKKRKNPSTPEEARWCVYSFGKNRKNATKGCFSVHREKRGRIFEEPRSGKKNIPKGLYEKRTSQYLVDRGSLFRFCRRKNLRERKGKILYGGSR